MAEAFKDLNHADSDLGKHQVHEAWDEQRYFQWSDDDGRASRIQIREFSEEGIAKDVGRKHRRLHELRSDVAARRPYLALFPIEAFGKVARLQP
jgi:hypothetical protein